MENLGHSEQNYLKTLDELGMTHNEYRSIVENTDDILNMDINSFSLYLDNSSIEGIGLFASKNFNGGDYICPVLLGTNRTLAGRYTNHSDAPNVSGEILGNSIHYIAIKGVGIGDEILVDYSKSFKKLKEFLCLG